MKFFLLRLLEKKPMSGYELMREVKRIVGSASPGTVYPILRWWEERGFVEKKDKYYLTLKGREFLKEIEEKRREYLEKVKKELMALSRALNDSELEKMASYLPLRDKIGEEGILVLSRMLEVLVSCREKKRAVEELKDLLAQWEKLC